MIAQNLYDLVLKRPARQGATELCIVSGYAESEMAWTHWEDDLNGAVHVRLLIGMPPEGDAQRLRAYLIKLQCFQQLAGYSELPDFAGTFECRYVVSGPPLHSKLYVWLDGDGTEVRAYVGSPNYSRSAFDPTMRGEIVTSDLEDNCYTYFRSHWDNGMDCRNPMIEERLRRLSRRWIGR